MTRLRHILTFLACAVFALCTVSAFAQDWAKSKLEQSTRHREYVSVKSGSRTINTLVMPSANGKLFVGGFCWGGGKSFAFATHRSDLSAAFVFYGPPPPAADMAKINAPVYGFYAGNDARISSTIPQTITDMKAAGKFYEPVTYADAGHGFMRAGQAPDAKPGDKKAFDEGYARLLKQLKANTAKRVARAVPVRKLGGTTQQVGAHRPAMDCAGMHSAL